MRPVEKMYRDFLTASNLGPVSEAQDRLLRRFFYGGATGTLVILDKNRDPNHRQHVAAALATDAARFVIDVRNGEA